MSKSLKMFGLGMAGAVMGMWIPASARAIGVRLDGYTGTCEVVRGDSQVSVNLNVTAGHSVPVVYGVTPLHLDQTTTGSAATDAVACSAFDPIRWSAKDTDETIRQVKGHNAAWKAVCTQQK